MKKQILKVIAVFCIFFILSLLPKDSNFVVFLHIAFLIFISALLVVIILALGPKMQIGAHPYSKTKYKNQIQQIDGYLDSLEDRFSQTLNTVSLPIDSNTISKLRTCLGDMQDAILSKIPKGSQKYKHLQKEFPNLQL